MANISEAQIGFLSVLHTWGQNLLLAVVYVHVVSFGVVMCKHVVMHGAGLYCFADKERT